MYILKHITNAFFQLAVLLFIHFGSIFESVFHDPQVTVLLFNNGAVTKYLIGF
jgi:hypothetical protein